MNNISGYLVLRKPQFNFDKFGRGMYSKIAPQIKNTYYSGIDRMQWFELDDKYYEGSLSEKLKKVRLEIRNKNIDLDYKLCCDINICKEILKLSNENEDLNEIVGISYSQGKSINSNNLSLLGFDIFSNGYGSLLVQGLYKMPDEFTEYVKLLNQYGLFSNEKDLYEYVDAYNAAAEQLNLEDIPDIPRNYKSCMIYNVNI